MEMQPPQAPPAYVDTQGPQATAIATRLRAVETWLNAQQQQQPLPVIAPGDAARDTFLAALEAFWQQPVPTAPGADFRPRIAVLARHLAAILRDDALLRQQQGTLADDAARLAAQVARSADAPLPTGIRVRELLLGDSVLAGALVAEGPGGPLAFLPERGWRQYTSMDHLHADTEDWLRHVLALRATLPGARDSAVEQAVTEETMIASRDIGVEGTFTTLAQGLVAMQRQQVIDAWSDPSHGTTPVSIGDAVSAALDLHAKLGLPYQQQDRDALHGHAQQEARLAKVPRDVAEAWRVAANEFRMTLDQGITDVGSQGTPDLPAVPDDSRSPESVSRYRDELIALLDPAGDAKPRRDASARLRRAQPRLNAVDARLSNYISDEPAAFISDHAERGYRWLEAVVDSPEAAHRRKVEGHDIVARQLTYRGAVVGDVLVVGARDRRSVPRVVFYTPGAPDGRFVREFDDAAHAAREFLYNPRFESYLLDRLPASLATADANGGMHFEIPEGTRKLAWILGQPGRQGQTPTAEPFDERDVTGDVFAVLHDTDISRMVKDMSDLEDSLRANRDAPLWQGVARVRDALTPGNVLVRETIAGADRGLRAMWRLGDSIRAGDYSQAAIDGAEAYTGLLNLMPVAQGASRPASFARMFLGGATRVSPASATTTNARLFDNRYAATGVDLANARIDARGLHRVNGRAFIRQEDRVWEVRFDSANDTWRLVRQGAADAQWSGPAIQWRGEAWRLRRDVGLRGGWNEANRLPPEGPGTHVIRSSDMPDAFTMNQRLEFRRTLRERLGALGAEELLFDVASAGGVRPVGAARAQAWRDALAAGARAPLVGPPVAPAYRLVLESPWREVPLHEWPDSVWYYGPGWSGPSLENGHTLFAPVVRARGAGARGVVTTSVDPAVYASRGGRVPTHGAIEIHLDTLRGQRQPNGYARFRLFVNNGRGTPSYILRPNAADPGVAMVLRGNEFTVIR
ncbi:hypothetical protein KPL74_16015 [Bacillus sp. NP157]|nr:hypothetical protein KPL74_16015 [Bacillus sp. NP157]